MPKPFHELTLEQFADLLRQFSFVRKIDSVHVHHTWRPNHANFASHTPIASIDGMYDFHTRVNGWSDIAQHITIDPRGIIWTGRDWNRQPASSTGFNGNTVAGPFMFEMIGDFDAGRDPFAGSQKATALGVVAHLLDRFQLPSSQIRFHNQMSGKTCPGSGIDQAAFIAEVEAVRATFAASAGAARAFGADVSEVRQNSLRIAAAWDAAPSRAVDGVQRDEGELPEETASARDVATLTGGAASGSRGIFGDTPTGFTADEKQILRRHVVNLRLGEFSTGGIYETSLQDIERIFNELLPEELDKRKAEGQPLRIVFYAHGGLTSEESGIRPILRRLPFWRENGLYPIFFCWETGLKETVVDLVTSLFKGQRGFVDNTIDAALEFAAGTGGRQIWSQMKRVAELASLPGGGARTVAAMTRDFWNDHQPDMEIHALGHSAGSIFHAFFLPALLEMKAKNGVPAVKVKSLHFLAPAMTTALFHSTLLPLIGPNKKILEHTMYTMNKDLEQADKAGPYHKSLLYFVSRAFETGSLPAPILGLEESLRDDSRLIRAYGLSRTVPGVAQILFSKTADSAPLDSRTRSTTHGDFDNEANTMNSVARRILARPVGNIVGFTDETAQNEVTRGFTIMPASRGPVAAVATSASGTKRALCIGIDAYPAPNDLHGCVNDARDWAATLTSLGFSAQTLLNQDATHAGMLNAMRELIQSSQAGDVVVIQYAGHGTSVQDLDGDEITGNDQALVPVDYAAGRFIIDDEIRALMIAIPDGVNVTCLMDCCNSATNTRLFGATPPPLPPGAKVRFMPVDRALMDAHVAFRSAATSVHAPARTLENMREINFAACLEHEQAIETNGSGDFTRRAVTILKQGSAMTNEEFQRQVTLAFGPSPRQHPKVDGGPDSGKRLLFGGTATTDSRSSDLASRLAALEARIANLGG